MSQEAALEFSNFVLLHVIHYFRFLNLLQVRLYFVLVPYNFNALRKGFS